MARQAASRTAVHGARPGRGSSLIARAPADPPAGTFGDSAGEAVAGGGASSPRMVRTASSMYARGTGKVEHTISARWVTFARCRGISTVDIGANRPRRMQARA